MFSGEIFANPDAPTPDCDQEQIPTCVEEQITNEKARFDFGFSVRNGRVSCKRIVLIWEDHRVWTVSQGQRKKRRNPKLSRSQMEQVRLMAESSKASDRSHGGKRAIPIRHGGGVRMVDPSVCQERLDENVRHRATDQKRRAERKQGEYHRSREIRGQSRTCDHKVLGRDNDIPRNTHEQRKKDEQRKPPTKKSDSTPLKTLRR
jgi:hypothetical protein